MPDGNIKVLVEGIERAKAVEINDTDGFFVATVKTGKALPEMTPQIEQLMQRVTSLFEQYVKLQQSLNFETMIAAVRMDEPAKLADTIAANLQLEIAEKQELLDIFDPAERLLASPTCSTSRSKSSTWTAPSSPASSGRWSAPRKSTTSTKRSRPSRKNWAAAKRASSTS